ncbi:ankyrin repeat domain-containing protein (plasmid) [Legionella lytica]|uniref:Ankyrin repeat domain-containing protein n=1 Tax=Legionella lytica TaxID=96232 RepID=A0ABY4YCT4_9GAMM|nr:RasGEF domain-containing protein [Legionella lytica]USQ15429.1 ankyrin repeat domain-containing protein [Legionella lytica]
MNEQAIKNLITSNDNEKNIAKTLIKWFNQDSSLLDITYLLDQNVFHFLMRKSKFYVIEKLLENETWRSKASHCDRSGHTVLHYAAKCDASCIRILALLMGYFPELLNKADNSGNTPIHTAVLHNQSWAVQMLVKSPLVNRSLPNLKGESPMRLAVDNKELNQALFCIELASLEQLDLRYRSPNSSTKEMLWKEFPLLSSRSHIDNASSSSSNSKPCPSTPRAVIADTIEENSGKNSHDNQIVTTDQLIYLVQDLIIAYKIDSHTSRAIKLQEQFNQFCLHHSVENIIDFDKADLDAQQVRLILSKAINFLYPIAHKRYSLIQHEFNSLLKLFAYSLVNNQLLVETPPLGELNISTEKHQNIILLQKLWLLTAGQEMPNSTREFDFGILSRRILGLLNSYSLMEILIGLRIIYSDCDLAQKSIANFLIIQLLFYHVIEHIALPPLLGMHLRFLSSRNMNPTSNLGEMGKQFNEYLEKAFQLSSMISSQPVLHNFYIIRQQLSYQKLVATNNSFDDLINQALALPPKKRIEHVKLIAHELRSLTMAFYQRVSVVEFRDEGWLKEKRQQSAPHITELTKQFNKLSAYFSEKVLTQSAENIQNALQFLIELAQHLCPLDSEHYLDLNHLMMLSSVFNSIGISRLTNVFNTMSSTEQSIIDEVNHAVSNKKNFKFMRDIYNAYRTTLPFLGYILTETTFANSGNDNELVRAEMVGVVLKKLMEIKVQVNFEQATHSTTLPLFLENYTAPNEEFLYQNSLKIQPQKEEKSPRKSLSMHLGRTTLFHHLRKAGDGNKTTDVIEISDSPRQNNG